MGAEVLRAARVAALGLDTTTGDPPLIVAASVYCMDAGVIAGGPFSYWSTVDAPRHEVPARHWPNLRHAPDWPETAGRLVEVIADRVLVMHEPDRWNILRRHLPDWQPAGVVLTRNLAEQAWPGLTDYSLGSIGVEPRGPDLRGPGAVVEAQVIALLVATLLRSTEAGLSARHDGVGEVR
jgi:hypothetical protein